MNELICIGQKGSQKFHVKMSKTESLPCRNSQSSKEDTNKQVTDV